MRKLFLLFLIIILASFTSADICCENGCFDNPATLYGLDYNVDCCSDGNAGVRCGIYDLISYCEGIDFGCLTCKNNGPDQRPFGTYYWEADNCGACKVCSASYNQHTLDDGQDYDFPTSSGCVFEIDPVSGVQYHCIGGLDICLVEGGISGDYCCKTEDINPSDGNGDVDIKSSTACDRYIGTPPNENICYYGSTPICSATNGWECTAYTEDPVADYTNCHTTGYLDDKGTPEATDDVCYYTDRIVECTQTQGWQCTSGDSCDIGLCTVPSDSDDDDIPDVCDTETTPEDCIDDIDNDGDGNCDADGCSGMPADPDCSVEICNECGGIWACSEETCEIAYRSSTGSGSCYYDTTPLIPHCCDDSDNDNVCDSNDNCQWDANTDQSDYDNDRIGDVCDLCPTIKQTEKILSDDNKELCTTSGEITCLESNKCEIEFIGEEFFCNGDIWISVNQCHDCFYSDDMEYYWIDNKDKVCDLTTPQLIVTDESELVCELLEPKIQENCEDSETGCWDSAASGSNTKCCGDDSSDDEWSTANGVCSEGIFYTDPDNIEPLCQMISGDTDGCNTFKEIGCWDSSSSRCCGDDPDETWIYSTNTIIDNILIGEGCYKGSWFIRTHAKVTYYEIFI